jgi:amidase
VSTTGSSMGSKMKEASAHNGRPGSQPVWSYSTITELLDALRRRRVSAVELLQETITRIETLDPNLNAVVVRDFERALKAARAADDALARGEQRPLLGIPMAVKESFNVAGLPTTWGIPQFRDFVPKDDAAIISRVKNAGAIVFGKTNVPLRLSDAQTYNEIYGTTNNPWGTNRTPGGSSGGSAAALAAGFGPLSLGSDLGGSLRVPAHFCGIYAHKPTYGLVPARGHAPPQVPSLPRELDFAVVGPMARSAADLAIALNVIAGPDDERAGIAYRLALPPPRQQKLKDFRVLVLDAHPLVPTGSVVLRALNQLAERLAKAGTRIARANPLLPSLADSARVYMRLLSSLGGANAPAAHYGEMQKAAEGLAPDDNSLAAERTRGAVMSHRDWVAADIARARLQQQWSSLFREIDVVLCPITPTPAFAHDHSPADARHIEIDGKAYPYADTFLVWAELATNAGLPSTALPIDRPDSGLPIGVQIVGPYLEDRTTIAFAGLLEQEFGGFEPPPGYAV